MASSMIPFLLALLLSSHLAVAKVVTYNWNLGWITANPDGIVRPVVGINGQFPLPTINVTLGDQIVINAVNSLGNSSATLHFHGIYQNGSTAQDGPYQISQCGIPSGQSLTYSFTVSQPGTYFYHSHYEGQYPDGLRGALIVQDPNSPFKGQYDEEIVVTLSDWYHDQMPSLTNYYLNSSLNEDGSEPIPYSALMNDAQNTKLYVQPDKTYFLRIINFACFSQMFLHFDQHQMTIIEIDGIYTKPRVVDNVYLAVAQRYGVLLKTKPTASKNYAALAKLDETMYDPWDTSLPNNGIPTAVNPDVTGYLVYDNKKVLPRPLKISLAEFYANKIDDFTLTPYDNEPLLQNPTQTFVLELRFFEQDGQNRAGFNNITWLAQKVPTLFTAMSTGSAATNNITYGVNANAMVLNHNEVIEVVINNFDGGWHPIHIHGHAPQLVARANGTYTPSEDYHRYRPVTPNPGQQMGAMNALGYGSHIPLPPVPMRRDTWLVAPNGYTVIRFVANNPGVWFFHCHMDWHNIAGLAATFVEAPLELQKSQSIPPQWSHLCRSQGIPTQGNAAGNTHHYTDLTGANTVCPPLPPYSGPKPI